MDFLKGKRALVTGSSRGIGRAIAVELASCGAEVIVHCASSVSSAKTTLDLIHEAGGKATALAANLCSIEECDCLAKEMGDIDILVLNASLQYKNKWDNIPYSECVEQLNCNFVSSLRLIQAAVPYMKEQKWGRIVTIGSVQEAKPHPDMLVYSASKAAQTNMVQSLSLQLATDGITVNNVAPGVIYTDRNVEALSDEEYAKKVRSLIPVGFYGMPDDLRGILRLLCSDEARYITGQSIYVDGGKGIM
jgi:NAD(P)-dependent dehydrogenase (short-subunit alcohol dehydrogenase family)